MQFLQNTPLKIYIGLRSKNVEYRNNIINKIHVGNNKRNNLLIFTGYIWFLWSQLIKNLAQSLQAVELPRSLDDDYLTEIPLMVIVCPVGSGS